MTKIILFNTEKQSIKIEHGKWYYVIFGSNLNNISIATPSYDLKRWFTITTNYGIVEHSMGAQWDVIREVDVEIVAKNATI